LSNFFLKNQRKIFAKKNEIWQNIFVQNLSIYYFSMTLNAPNFSENSEISTTVNSLDDIRKFLAENKISNFIIEKVAQSFMAKIPAKTRVSLVDNLLKVGDSVISLGENIRETGVKTLALVKNTNSLAMRIVNQYLPAVQPKHQELAAA
jgi:hypothetical protein